ncbi:hypothetical protein E2C01_089861 [Portunus trituberculatus]|uniref:Uncharacterized protein n=1 Tax=Portunus trituberculatus TaxID=210409 RepID=A0A5B7JEQ9_PORTR|nr:hypothetical protein [Portunus trituberculatus]
MAGTVAGKASRHVHALQGLGAAASQRQASVTGAGQVRIDTYRRLPLYWIKQFSYLYFYRSLYSETLCSLTITAFQRLQWKILVFLRVFL